MKHTTHTLSAAILIGLSGVANAMVTSTTSTDNFFVQETAHPHEDTKQSKRQVWIQQMSDGEHVYELRMEDGVYIVSIDGDQVPNNRIKKTDSSVILLKGNGDEIYEFDLNLSANRMGGLQNTSNLFFTPSRKSINESTAEVSLKPKVMLGIYTDDPGESLRKHLKIKGHAILVDRVIKGLSADQAGIKDRDIIISINGSDGVSPEELTELLAEKNPGDEIKIVVLRNGQQLKIGTALMAYNAEVLRESRFPNGEEWIGVLPKFLGTVRTPPTPQSPIKFFDNTVIEERTHQKILETLRQEGIGEKKIAEVEKQIRASLQENVWRQLAEDRSAEQWFALNNLSRNDQQLNAHRFLPGNLQQKAEDAIRHAERLTLEYKDGQLLLKRHAKEIEGKIQKLQERVQETMPKIESELQGRLVELESRLDQLESALDSKMDSLSGLIEQLIERLDED